MGFFSRLRSLSTWGRSVYGYGVDSPQPIDQDADVDALVKSFFSWVYVCSSKNACRVASQPLRLFAETGGRKLDYRHRVLSGDLLSHHKKILRNEKAVVVEILSHPLVDLLNRVNSYQGRFELFELTELGLELTGNAYWWLVPGPLGLPGEILILPPQLVKIKLDAKNLIAAYVFGHSPNEKTIPADQVIHFRFPDPSGSVYGYAPAKAAWGSILDDRAMRTYERALNANLGVPSLFVSYDGKYEKPEMARAEADWNRKFRGLDKSGKVIVGDSGFKVQSIGLSPRDMSFREGRKWARTEIACAFGVPLDLLDPADSNRATSTTANHTYNQFTIQPRLTRISDKLNERLCPLYDSRLYVEFDNCVGRDEAQYLNETVQLTSAKILTINEARERYNLAPLPEPTEPPEKPEQPPDTTETADEE
jgi:HK97 family phage portal protein